MVEDINNLIIVEHEEDDNGKKFQGKGKIICKFRLKYCDVVEINKFKPKSLVLRNMLSFKNNAAMGREGGEEYILHFEKEELSSYAESFLKKNKKDIKKLELALIIKILHQSESDLLPLKQ